MPLISITFTREEIPQGNTQEIVVESFLREAARLHNLPDWTAFKDAKGNDSWPRLYIARVPLLVPPIPRRL